jgi:drug/metabolite transporter (DMT)-like permease
MNIYELEFDILIIAVALAFLYGLSPIAYKLIIINNKISFDIYLILSSMMLFVFSLMYSMLFHKKFNLIREINSINPLTVLYFSFYIFFVVFISQLLFHIAIEKTTKLALFTLITSLYPIITIVLSLLVYNKKVSMKIVLGFLVSMLGLYIMLR